MRIGLRVASADRRSALAKSRHAGGATFDAIGNTATLSGTIGRAGGRTNVDAGTLRTGAAAAFSSASNFNVANRRHAWSARGSGFGCTNWNLMKED